MSDTLDPVLKTAVLEWQKKYGVKDGDPLLASLELFQIYFASWQNQQNGPGGSSYDEFRGSFEALEHRTKSLSKLATEMIHALRGVPRQENQFRRFSVAALAIVAVLAIGIGVGIGKFLL